MNDHVAEAYGVVRDATVNNSMLTAAESIAVLELVKCEIVNTCLKTTNPQNEVQR